MKALVTVLAVVAVVGVAGSILGWQEVRRLSAENEALRAQRSALQDEAKAQSESLKQRHQAEVDKLSADAREVFKLRGEVSQLRGGAQAISQLQESNRRLQTENQKLRQASGAPAPEIQAAGGNVFPKESWEFLGYTTPEDALISAIWTMQQGDPQAYFDSLAPAEQERMSARWEEKSETEVSEKHQSDVAAISGLQVLNSRQVSETEVVMDVYIEGPGRMQSVSMQRLDDEWRFGGYVSQDDSQ